jgi:hypothetical protein
MAKGGLLQGWPVIIYFRKREKKNEKNIFCNPLNLAPSYINKQFKHLKVSTKTMDTKGKKARRVRFTVM